MPGSTPTSVPSVTPIAANSRCSGRSAVPKPPSRLARTSIAALHDRVEEAGGQPDAEELGEGDPDDDRDGRADEDVAKRIPAAEQPRCERDEGSRREDVTDGLERDGISDEDRSEASNGQPMGGGFLLRSSLGQPLVGPNRASDEERDREDDETNADGRRDEAWPDRAEARPATDLNSPVQDRDPEHEQRRTEDPRP